MKKKYTTPYLLVEDFQLDTAVASCSIPFHHADDSCIRVIDIYFDSNLSCETDVVGQDENYCYHGQFAPGTFFSS